MESTKFTMVQHPGGWVSASPLPTRAELQEFYTRLYYQTPQSTTYQETYDPLDLRYRQLKCAAMLQAFRDHGLQNGAEFLDIGAGEGFLMDAADRDGFSVTGTDFSSFAIEKFFPRLRSRLIDGDILETIDGLASNGRQFAACSAINVLEHVIDPEALLSSIRRIIARDGVLAVTVPNDFSTLQALLRQEQRVDRDFWFAPPQHLHYFNAQNLPGFCESRGYQLLDAFSDFPIDLYLLHPGSNYVISPANGKAAHRARLLHDLLIAEAGLDVYLNFYRAMFKVGIGRDLTVILRSLTG